MPKITKHGGPSYAGLVDVSPPGVDEPDWAQAPESEPVDVEAPAEPVKPSPRPRARTRKG